MRKTVATWLFAFGAATGAAHAADWAGKEIRLTVGPTYRRSNTRCPAASSRASASTSQTRFGRNCARCV
ncbi:hypothetical protein [Burkholderia oklahomensis]|uniref:Uncharacterized protein n=1 Tax=Burkholderia oklahomensis TaxID=342113 RepID=A0AAI8FRP4_9BURK|nr:hypothetical protein [Burkholderia oklahomensis]AIO70936.1 hypothetical protein DM82_5119 [Burkholderia oklahomensis]